MVSYFSDPTGPKNHRETEHTNLRVGFKKGIAKPDIYRFGA